MPYILILDSESPVPLLGLKMAPICMYIYRVTDGNWTFLKWLVGGSYVG